MAEAASQNDSSESMEDILQSIKRIIENDTDGAPAKPASADVLELTQVVADDGKVSPLTNTGKIAPETAKAPSPDKEVKKPVIDAIQRAPAAEAPEAAPPAAPKSAPLMAEGLVSDQAAQAALAALKPISETQRDTGLPHFSSPPLRSGTTVEDLLLEALRPMLKSWLDEHLPIIVQKVVEKEVKRIVAFHKD